MSLLDALLLDEYRDPQFYNPWRPKSGQRIVGAGMGLTTIKIVRAIDPEAGYAACAQLFLTSSELSSAVSAWASSTATLGICVSLSS